MIALPAVRFEGSCWSNAKGSQRQTAGGQDGGGVLVSVPVQERSEKARLGTDPSSSRGGALCGLVARVSFFLATTPHKMPDLFTPARRGAFPCVLAAWSNPLFRAGQVPARLPRGRRATEPGCSPRALLVSRTGAVGNSRAGLERRVWSVSGLRLQVECSGLPRGARGKCSLLQEMT